MLLNFDIAKIKQRLHDESFEPDFNRIMTNKKGSDNSDPFQYQLIKLFFDFGFLTNQCVIHHRSSIKYG